MLGTYVQRQERMAETLYGKQCRAAPNCAMAVALARLFYMTDAEESVFVIDRERFPRMITVWSCYEAFKNIAYSLSWEDGLIEQACQQHPDWCSAGISESEFSDFAKAFGGLTHREAHVFYTKHDFWRARAGVSQYHYGA